MAIVKVIEVLAQSETSWEDATQQAVDEVAETIHNIQSVYIKDFEAKVQDNRVTAYRVTAKVSFLIDRN